MAKVCGDQQPTVLVVADFLVIQCCKMGSTCQADSFQSLLSPPEKDIQQKSVQHIVQRIVVRCVKPLDCANANFTMRVRAKVQDQKHPSLSDLSHRVSN